MQRGESDNARIGSGDVSRSFDVSRLGALGGNSSGAYRRACRNRRKSTRKLQRFCKVISRESIDGFEVFEKQLEAFKPDVLLVVGDDQGEVFTEANMPTFCLFTCAEVHGSINIGLIGEPEEENHITLRCHADLARYLLTRVEPARDSTYRKARNSNLSAGRSAVWAMLSPDRR